MRQLDRHGHQFGGFVAGVAEHHALIAGAAGINAHGDVGRLRLDAGQHAASFGVEAVLGAGVADVAESPGGRSFRTRERRELFLDRDFAGDHDKPGGDERLASHAAHGVVLEHGVETASEIWSAILSGWPSVTDSEVNRNFSSMRQNSILRRC